MKIDVPESGYDRELRGKWNPRKIVGMVEKREKKGEVKKRAKDAETNKEGRKVNGMRGSYDMIWCQNLFILIKERWERKIVVWRCVVCSLLN